MQVRPKMVGEVQIHAEANDLEFSSLFIPRKWKSLRKHIGQFTGHKRISTQVQLLLSCSFRFNWWNHQSHDFLVCGNQENATLWTSPTRLVNNEYFERNAHHLTKSLQTYFSWAPLQLKLIGANEKGSISSEFWVSTKHSIQPIPAIPMSSSRDTTKQER